LAPVADQQLERRLIFATALLQFGIESFDSSLATAEFATNEPYHPLYTWNAPVTLEVGGRKRRPYQEYNVSSAAQGASRKSVNEHR
jgi:hypothetical protein